MSKRPRKHIPLSELLASALADNLPPEQRDQLRAAKVSAQTIIRLFTPDHAILHSMGGSDKWWNIIMSTRGPALKAKDRRDTSIAAKTKRLTAAQEATQRAILKPCGQKRQRTSRIQSRGFDKRKFSGTQAKAVWK